MGTRKYCMVPMCPVTEKKKPEKLFISVPMEEPLRTRWFNAMRRDLNHTPLSSKSKFFVCEDHFDLDTDIVNIKMVKFYIERGYKRPAFQLRPGLVPHKFDCQSGERLLTAPPEKRRKSCAVDKLNSKRTLCALLQEEMKSATEEDDKIESAAAEEDNLNIDFSGLFIETAMQTEPQVSDKGIQARPTFRSKGVQATIKKETRDASTDTADIKMKNIASNFDNMSSSSLPVVSSSTSSSSLYIPQSSSVSSSPSSSHKASQQKGISLSCSFYHIEKNPKLYLGITSDCYFVISILSDYTKSSRRDLCLTLKKIRTDDVFERLGDDFGMSSSNASKVFKKTLSLIAPLLAQLIFMPDKKWISMKLPIPFRKNFSKTVSIIDCFEVQIEKPGDPLKQAMTWSQYYGCNTFKYLVSCTPNGFINFISPGFTGRISDPDIVKESGFINILSPGVSVMADRGFKHLGGLLNEFNVKLVRPPSVSKHTALSKEDALSAKRIASLRVHIERVIGRIRDYKLLKPRSTVDNKLIPYLDVITVCVAGLVNLQSVIL